MTRLPQAATLKAFPNLDLVSAVLAADAAIAILNAGKSFASDVHIQAT